MATPDVRVRLSAEGVAEVVAALKKVQADTERDNFMSAAEACKYGLIDKVLASRGELDGEK